MSWAMGTGAGVTLLDDSRVEPRYDAGEMTAAQAARPTGGDVQRLCPFTPALPETAIA